MELISVSCTLIAIYNKNWEKDKYEIHWWTGTEIVVELVIQMDNWNVKSAEICFNINEAIYHKIQKHFEDAYLYYYQVYHLVHIY